MQKRQVKRMKLIPSTTTVFKLTSNGCLLINTLALVRSFILFTCFPCLPIKRPHSSWGNSNSYTKSPGIVAELFISPRSRSATLSGLG